MVEPRSTDLRLLRATIRARWRRCRRSTDVRYAIADGALPSHPSDDARDGGHRWTWALRGQRDERGAATAELVMVIPLLVAVTIGLVWLLSVGAAQIQVVDAARETARAVARGDDSGSAGKSVV